MNIFEQASKSRLRFDTAAGAINAEDLWQLPLTSKRSLCLDNIAVKLNNEVNNGSRESYVTTVKPVDLVAKLKFDIVKHIIDVKIEENKAKVDASVKKAQKDRILSLIATKQDDALASKSLEELEALL